MSLALSDTQVNVQPVFYFVLSEVCFLCACYFIRNFSTLQEAYRIYSLSTVHIILLVLTKKKMKGSACLPLKLHLWVVRVNLSWNPNLCLAGRNSETAATTRNVLVVSYFTDGKYAHEQFLRQTVLFLSTQSVLQYLSWLQWLLIWTFPDSLLKYGLLIIAVDCKRITKTKVTL